MAKKQAPLKSKRKSGSASPLNITPEPKRNETVKDDPPRAEPPPSPHVTTKNVPPPPKSPHPALSSSSRATLPAEAALSFLRDTKGSLSWSLRDLLQTLHISRDEAERAVALLQSQGYVQSHKSGEWITTQSGETVSGAKSPRFDRETVEAALTSLKERIQNTNKDRAAKFEITRAVAFGDFLIRDRTRVQAVEVGIELVWRDGETSGEHGGVHSAVQARAVELFLRQLRGRSAPLYLKPYSEWMDIRTHQKLL